MQKGDEPFEVHFCMNEYICIFEITFDHMHFKDIPTCLSTYYTKHPSLVNLKNKVVDYLVHTLRNILTASDRVSVKLFKR